jgi:PAS domain S-box-containing protein
MTHDTATVQALQDENTRLRSRIDELEAAEREQRDLLTFTIKYNPNAIAIFDKNLHYMQVSDRYRQDYGLGDQPIIGRHHYDVFPEMPQRWRDVHARCLAGAIESSDEDSFVREDGSITYNRWDCRPWYNAQGEVGGLTIFTEVITERKQAEHQLRLFKALVENSPDSIASSDLDGTLLYLNPAFQQQFGYTGDEPGLSLGDINAPDEHERLNNEIIPSMTQGIWRGVLNYRRKDGSIFPGDGAGFVIRDESGQPQAFGGIIRDISEQVRQEEERQSLQAQVIEAQRAALRELSTPLIPVSDRVVIMPLIGSIDSQRAQQVMETLLEGVAAHRAEMVILDITGVQVVDTQVANTFIRAAQAVQLLGAQVMLTGIGPNIAQTLVQLGVDLSGMLTRGSLQAGIADALQARNGERTKRASSQPDNHQTGGRRV